MRTIQTVFLTEPVALAFAVAAALGGLAGCERADTPTVRETIPVVAHAEVAGASSMAVEIDPTFTSVEREPDRHLPLTLDELHEQHRLAGLATAPLPKPPSVEPEAYADWIADQPDVIRQRIARVCRKNRLNFEEVCGGIGPLHIPYPPRVRISIKKVVRDEDGDIEGSFHTEDRPKSLFASMEQWQSSLTTAQFQYFRRECRGEWDSSDLCGDNTPLVVAFDNQPIEFATGGTFAFVAGHVVDSDWPTATTPWLALDRNADGAIDSGAELFGSTTQLANGTNAANGFVALRELDANHDGRIDASDSAFASLVLWSDRDGDQRSATTELAPISNSIISISLDDRLDMRCDARNNCEGERAAITWRGTNGATRTGTVVDVYLPRR